MKTILSVHGTGAIRFLSDFVTQEQVVRAVRRADLAVGFHHDVVVRSLPKSVQARRWDGKLGFGDMVVAVVDTSSGNKVITTVFLRDSKYPFREPRRVSDGNNLSNLPTGEQVDS